VIACIVFQIFVQVNCAVCIHVNCGCRLTRSHKNVTFVFTVLKQFQEYVEPDEGFSSTVLAGLATPSQSRRPAGQSVPASDNDGAASSLGDNTLTSNLGIPIIVVLTKVCASKNHCDTR
jgi:hypothetical protein